MNEKQQFHFSENGTLQPDPTQFPMPQGTFSPTGTFNDIYTTFLPQNSSPDRYQNKPIESQYIFPDLLTWDNFKFPDKIDVVELSNKELSPSGYYNSMNTIAPIENQSNGYESSQWGNSSNNSYVQKSGNYSSCAQVSKHCGESDKLATYCNIQKSSTERELFKSCAYYNSSIFYNQNKGVDTTQNCYTNFTTIYDSKKSMIPQNMCFSQNLATYGSMPQRPITNQKDAFDLNYESTLDHHTEASDDESDIVVEESTSNCSEEQDQSFFYQATKCLVCNMQYTSLGLQFYVLTSENPLTMSSQIPVKNKISEFISNNIFAEKNYLCNNCLGLVNTIDHLQLKLDNLIKDLSSKISSSCPRSNMVFKEKTQGKTRVKIGKYKCKKCNKILCIKTYLKNHLKCHKSQRYLCEWCGKTASTFKKFNNHLGVHKKPNTLLIPAFKCSNKHCDKNFKSKFHLKEHEYFCLALLPFKCKNLYCNKKFASTTKLKNHMKLKHDKKFIAICSICNIGFIKVSDYKSHMVSHSTAKKFSCNKCDKAYKTVSNLNFHLKIHEKSLPYTCAICQKAFMRKEYHEAHMNNHRGIKKFNCPVCNKSFVSQKNLDAHIKYHEGTVKSNTCTICKKIITSCFEEHLRVHSNLKEFECKLCDMKFNTKNSLSKHKKRKHLMNDAIT